MLLIEKEIRIPPANGHRRLLEHFAEAVARELVDGEAPVRFAVTRTSSDGYDCELGTLVDCDHFPSGRPESIFDLRKRRYENMDRFRAVLLVPTGVGAEIGGHSGDGGPLARLLAGACDTLITHPNVVNAADVNAMPENTLYVEGSVLSRFVAGTVGLQPVRANRVMLVIDDHPDPFFSEAAINSVSAARAAMGLDCPLVVRMRDRVLMRSLYASSGRAVGRIEHLQRLCDVLAEHRDEYDAAAISSMIEVPERFHADYFREDMDDIVNPWGGVEAMLTHAVSMLFNIPSAHSPMMSSKEVLDLDVGVVDPRKSAEAVSTTFLHCILHGLHRSPRIVPTRTLDGVDSGAGLLTAADISCLVIPDRCVGLPTLAALEQGIPVIAVRENDNCMENDLEALPWAPGKLFVVDNYLEAVGVMSALRAGVTVGSVRRPLPFTKVLTRSPNEDIENVMESVSGETDG